MRPKGASTGPPPPPLIQSTRVPLVRPVGALEWPRPFLCWPPKWPRQQSARQKVGGQIKGFKRKERERERAQSLDSWPLEELGARNVEMLCERRLPTVDGRLELRRPKTSRPNWVGLSRQTSREADQLNLGARLSGGLQMPLGWRPAGESGGSFVGERATLSATQSAGRRRSEEERGCSRSAWPSERANEPSHAQVGACQMMIRTTAAASASAASNSSGFSGF